MAAVQARYGHRQSHLFLAARGGAAPMELPQAHKETVTPPQQQHPLFLDFSHGDGDGGNGRNKRPREAVAAPPPRLSSLQTPQGSPVHKVISLAPRLHKRPAAAATGLRLDLDEGGSEHVPCTSSAASSLLPDDEFAAQCDRYKNETDRLLQEHAERLRRGLADARRRHGRSLLGAAAAAARRVREKEAEASRAARRGSELEERLARMRAEAAAWQAKALSDQSTAAALHAQLQQAAAAAQARRGEAAEEDDNAAGAAGDAESCFVDPDRVVEVVVAPPPSPPARPCRTWASIMLLPCRHLCMCDACVPAAVSASVHGATACPMCRCAVTGTVQVYFS